MPPKPKHTKQEVIQAAIGVIRESGADALTARKLAARLQTAPSAIFTHFSSMEQLLAEAVEAVTKIYDAYVQRGLKRNPPFKGFAMEIVHFAAEEPHLFSLLFMNPRGSAGIGDVIGSEGHEAQVLETITGTFPLSKAEAYHLYQDLWIYCHGIATLTATGVCAFSTAQLASMLGNACRGFLLAMQAPENPYTALIPSEDAVQDPFPEDYFFVKTGDRL